MRPRLVQHLTNLNRPTITDATGRTRHCTPIAGREALRGYPSSPDADRSKLIRSRLTGPALLLGLLAVMPMVCLSQSLFHVVIKGNVGFGATLALVSVILLVIVLIARRPLVDEYVAEHTAATLDASLCPWCLYTLSETPPDDEGLTTCPECGGVWQLPTPAPTL